MEEKSLTQLSIVTKIKSITLIDFSIENVEKSLLKSLNKDLCAFEFVMNIKIDKTNKELTTICTTTVFSNQDKILKLGEIKSQGIFNIINLDEILDNSKGKIPTAVLALHFGVLLSTTRGFFIIKTEGTFLEGVIIPITNTQQFFNPSNITIE